MVGMIIVCVDNTPIMLQNLKENAEKAYPDADVQAFRTVEHALQYAEMIGCDILLCEINPPRLEGLFLAEKIKNSNPKVNIIFVTVCSESEHAKAVMKLKPSGYLTKEVLAQLLKLYLNYCAKIRFFIRDVKRIHQQLECANLALSREI
jgi:DNA-binding NarL/FixJ family response regulator